MSLRLQMLQVARLAPRILGESSELCRNFLLGQITPEGGFRDRAGKSDLYYTVFGLGALAALDAVGSPGESLPTESHELRDRVAGFLRSFGKGEGQDFVHVCCLARGWASVASPCSIGGSVPSRAELLKHLERYRSRDGGFSPRDGSEAGTAYGAFLALGAYQDCDRTLPEADRLLDSLKHLETGDGAWANDRESVARSRQDRAASGATNATAAAVMVMCSLGQPVHPQTGDWLLAQAHPQGGFRPSTSAPVPDLLSTATALHALAALEIPFSHLKEKTLDFVDSLWTNEGGFYGHWADEHVDCEYTYYGLLALGHLSL